MSKRHPHILKICSDQHSPVVSGFAGDPWVRTPNLDRLAARGIVFDNCYAANPVCCPGRNCMVTGQLPREIGTCYFQDELSLETPTYMRHFSQHGYMTICSGKMHFHGPEQMHGWRLRPFGDLSAGARNIPGYTVDKDVMKGEGGPSYHSRVTGSYNAGMLKTARPGRDKFIVFDEHATQVAVDYLREYFMSYIGMGFDKGRPLLFEVSYITPHCPFVAPVELWEHYLDVVGPPRKGVPDREPPQIRRRRLHDQPEEITSEMIHRARVGYWALVQWMDSQIGVVLTALEQLGVLDDFLIMYCSDHGELAGERGLWQKSCFYEESVRCSMILAGGDLPRGARVKHNTSLYDIFPTLCDMANLPMPEGVRGRSMLPLIGSSDPDERIIFSELYGKYTQDFETPPVPQSMMAKQGDVKFVCYADGTRELFDLNSDPDEMQNRADDPAYAAVQRRLEVALAELPTPYRNRPVNPFFPGNRS